MVDSIEASIEFPVEQNPWCRKRLAKLGAVYEGDAKLNSIKALYTFCEISTRFSLMGQCPPLLLFLGKLVSL